MGGGGEHIIIYNIYHVFLNGFMVLCLFFALNFGDC